MASWLVCPTPERAVRDRLSAVIDRVSIFWKKKVYVRSGCLLKNSYLEVQL